MTRRTSPGARRSSWTRAVLLASAAGCAGAPGTQEPAPRWSAAPASDTLPAAPAETAEARFRAGGDLTLAEALARAVARRPELRARDHGLEAQRAELRRAERRPPPTLGLEAEDFAGQDALSGYDGAQTTLWLSQTIERGGKREARTRGAQAALELAALDRTIIALDLEAEVTSAFWRAVAARDALALAEAAEARAVEFHEIVTERVAAGRVSPVEEAKYAIALGGARLDATEARRALERAHVELARTWAGEPDFTTLLGELEPVPLPPADDELEERLRDGPRLRRLAAERERARVALDEARAETSANLEVRAGLRRFEETDDWAAILGLELPLQAGGRARDALDAARANRARREHESRGAELRLTAALSRARARWDSAHREDAALERDLVESAARVLESVDEGYREGKFDLLDVIDAQRTWFDLRARRDRARAAYRLAAAEIAALLGEVPR